MGKRTVLNVDSGKPVQIELTAKSEVALELAFLFEDPVGAEAIQLAWALVELGESVPQSQWEAATERLRNIASMYRQLGKL